MEIIKKGNSCWSLEVKCTGNGWNNLEKDPCFSILKLNKEDIYKRSYHQYEKGKQQTYGFICPVCHCFTEIDRNLIPAYTKVTCLNVAKKGSIYWDDLTDEEKKISEVL